MSNHALILWAVSILCVVGTISVVKQFAGARLTALDLAQHENGWRYFWTPPADRESEPYRTLTAGCPWMDVA